jgi:hypothetical protein
MVHARRCESYTGAVASPRTNYAMLVEEIADSCCCIGTSDLYFVIHHWLTKLVDSSRI